MNPTPDEKLMLGRFLKKLVKKKILESAEVPEKELLIPAPIGRIAPILVKEARPKKTTITAVRYEGGKLEIVEGTDRELVALGEKVDGQEKTTEIQGEIRGDVQGEVWTKATEAAETGSEAETKKIEGSLTRKTELIRAGDKKADDKTEDKAKSAVSVKRPTLSCPQCKRGAVGPASEVLHEFLTPEQHRRWAKERVIEVTGGLSGHRYLISHRHAKWAERWGRLVFDVEDQAVLHCHDTSVPPEEEVLEVALILEHREAWIRNEASCLGDRFRDVFKNPFGDHLDGVVDAGVTQAFGAIVKGLLQ